MATRKKKPADPICDQNPLIVSDENLSIHREQIDRDAVRTVRQLYRAGHTAYMVGGSVRDLIAGRIPKDFDIVTSARPAQVRQLFRNCRLIGRRFRLAHIHFLDGKILELATFRAKPDLGDQDDGLVIKDNTFGTPRLDALRRDFTVNSLFYDLSNSSIVDYVGGLQDIQDRVIRTIGEPNLRFQEDPVRMVRAIRFAARLNFDIEPETLTAIKQQSALIARSPSPRVVEEWSRLLEEGAAARAIRMLLDLGLMSVIEPTQEKRLCKKPAKRGKSAESVEQVGPDLFKLLEVVDDFKKRGVKLCRPLLFSLWLLPILCAQDFLECEQPETLVGKVTTQVLQPLGVSRKESEQCEETLSLWRRMVEHRKKRRTGRPLQNRECFLDALLLLEIYYLATGQFRDELEKWEELKPTPATKPLVSPYQKDIDEPSGRDRTRRVRRRR